tara:strand:+ start:575 stop:1444 length:870 start_codon:yes stop_codon:yes gene_type:complete
MIELYKNITITIVIYQESFEIISRCLINIKDFKIIIIDNSGNHKLKETILNNYKIFRYVINLKNLGFSKATNQAIKLSNSKYVLSIQADCKILIKDINKLYLALNKYDNCILVTPTFYNEKNNLTYSGGPLPEKKITIEILDLEGDTCVDIATTAAILFRKNDLIEIGLFDEDFFIYFPDFEIGRRIKNLNKSIIQVFDAKAIHEMGNLKINNIIKKVFFRNYYFTIDELIYYHKGNSFNHVYLDLKKKILTLILKVFLNLFLLRFTRSTKCFARVLAYYKFKSNFINK